MKNNSKKKGYTLAEIMVVMLILTVIFAAFAPLITKRQGSTNRSKYQVWSYTDFTSTMNAFYIPQSSTQTGTAFFGITPDGHGEIESTLLPFSRVVIRSGAVTSSNKLQRQMQFRYGHTNDTGTFAGTWLMANRNMLLGGEYKNLNDKPNNIDAHDNVGIGYMSLTNIKSGKGNTALGAYALANTTTGKNNTAIGYSAGYKATTSSNNTFLGSNAGKEMTGDANTVIGYSAGGQQGSSSGGYNVVVGAYAGQKISSASRNTAIGYNALHDLSSGEYNVALGVGALKNLVQGSYNVALGYNACGNLKYSSYKTCIGYDSGPTSGSTAERFLGAIGSSSGSIDTVQRTYIGSKPLEGYGGDAVMEIHNVGGSSNLINNPSVRSNTTTVINGNLIVRGKTYFTTGSNLWNFTFNKIYEAIHSDHQWLGIPSSNSQKCASNQTTYSFNTGCVSVSSDRRLKNIGTKFTAGLNELNKLKVYKYTFKNDPNKTPQIGVIAQELQKVFPNAVTTDNEGYLKIHWDEMFYTSINAIKELDKKITALIDRASDAEAQIAQLEKENAALKEQADALSLRIEKIKVK